MTTLQVGSVTVDVTSVGPSIQGFGSLTADEYAVKVSNGAHTYQCSAWGSNLDYLSGVKNPAELGYMVLGEIVSMYWDSEEFWEMAEPKGREAAVALIELEKAAEAFGAELGAPTPAYPIERIRMIVKEGEEG